MAGGSDRRLQAQRVVDESSPTHWSVQPGRAYEVFLAARAAVLEGMRVDSEIYLLECALAAVSEVGRHLGDERIR